MNITFHPRTVKTADEITAAKRFRKAKEHAKRSQDIFLANDGVEGKDHHDGDSQVAGRFEYKFQLGSGPGYRSHTHRGFVQEDGRISVIASHEEKTRSVRIERNEDQTEYTLEHLTRDGIKEKERFQVSPDGSVQYQRTTIAEPGPSSRPLSFKPGAVDSPEGVTAKELFDYATERMDSISSAVMFYDQAETNDLNGAEGEVALANTPIDPLEPILEWSNEHLGDRVSRLMEPRPSDLEIPERPKFTGYAAQSGELDSSIDWKLGELEGYEHKASFEFKRSSDEGSGRLDTMVQRPEADEYYNLSTFGAPLEYVVKGIEEETESIVYSTDNHGEITVEKTESTKSLPLSR